MTLSLLFYIISAIFLGIDSFFASAIGRVRLLSLGLFFLALGHVFQGMVVLR